MCFTYFLVPSFTSSTPIYYASIPFRALVMVLGWLLRTRITLRTGLISSRSSRQWADLHSSHRILRPEPFTAEVGGARGGRGGAAWSSGCSGPGGLQMTPNLPNALRGKGPAQEAGRGPFEPGLDDERDSRSLSVGMRVEREWAQVWRENSGSGGLGTAEKERPEQTKMPAGTRDWPASLPASSLMLGSEPAAWKSVYSQVCVNWFFLCVCVWIY